MIRPRRSGLASAHQHRKHAHTHTHTATTSRATWGANGRRGHFGTPARGVKNVPPPRIFLESNTDRNTRFYLAVAAAYFAYFGPYFRISVFGGLVGVFGSVGHAAAAFHAHVPRAAAAQGAVGTQEGFTLRLAVTGEARAGSGRPPSALAIRVRRAQLSVFDASFGPVWAVCVPPRKVSAVPRHRSPARHGWSYSSSLCRWGTATLGGRPGNGEASLFLPCERGSHSHTVVVTRPRLSLALQLLMRRVCHASGGRSRAVAQRAPIPSSIIAAFFQQLRS